MATVLSLAMKVSADASGAVRNLTPAERALENLGKQADKVTKVFDEFAGTSDAAADAQASAARSISDLTGQLKSGAINAQQFSEDYAALTAEINKEAAAFRRAAEITKANQSPLERYGEKVDELDAQLKAGRISQETYNRALEKAQADLNILSVSANKADKSLEPLVRNTKILASIEIGRLFVDGIQSLGNVFRDISASVSSLVTSVNGSIDTLNDFSARTGLGVEQLQGYSLAAKLAGVDTEQFGTAVQKLAVNIGKAAPGDAFDKSLKGINLSVQELRAISPEEQFSAIGQAISQLPTAADRAAAAVEIFGKQGAALAPLFREGAASLEELQARAEMLGVIVSETQVNNVADMNDAFDLVRATIEGITGQVIGNLAPAVTAVTNQFLQFVESWSGAQGEGGTGIANAITDVLLQGAEYFAAVFDDFIARFDSLGLTLQDAGASFVSGANAFTFVSESLRTVANVFELAGNAISAGLGKIIETLGRFVSDDLEQYGKELARQAMIATEQNSRQLEESAANAANAFNSIFTGGSGNAAAAGKGAASEYLSGLREEIERARLPEVQLKANLELTQKDLKTFLDTATGGTSAFLQESVATLETFQQMVQQGELTADQIQIMNGFAQQLNAELLKEKQLRQDAADAAQAQADSDKKRLDQLLETNDAAAKIEADLAAVQREQSRVSEQLAAARADDNQAQADANAARLAELDQLQAKLEEQQQALEQGFGQGFQVAFEAVDSNINQLIEKSQQFGQAGFDAAVRLQEGIALAQEQARDGILNAEAYQQEVQRQQDLFNNELRNIDEAEKARTKAAEDRLAAEQRQQEVALQSQNQFIADRLNAEEQAADEQRRVQEQIYQYQQRVLEEQQKAAAAEAKRQEDRLRALNTLGPQSLSVQDVRTQAGASLVIQAAANAQDPAAIQQRLQTKYLEQIAAGIIQASKNYFNAPVAIVGYGSLGDVRA